MNILNISEQKMKTNTDRIIVVEDIVEIFARQLTKTHRAKLEK